MKKLVFLALAFVASLPLSAQHRITQEHKDRAAEVVSQMTLEEKLEYIGGLDTWFIRAIPRLGIPAIRMADGPQGVRHNTKGSKGGAGYTIPSTLYPSGVAAAATWDRALINEMGIALGKDARARGVHILLGPGANIYRSPMCGRNFEYFGEDPYLAGEMAVSYIKGVQSQNVLACIKHFAGNNQEYARHNVSSDIDVRTLHEIYFPAFEKAVKEGDVATIMTSYNLLNSVHCSENEYLNYTVLRDMWGFGGLVMSDWTSTYSPLNAGAYGVDIEMPRAKCMKPELMKELVQTGIIPVEAIDRKCQHILQTLFAYGFDKNEQLDSSIPENNPYSDSVSCEISRSAVVMLKNQDDFLPVRKGKVVVCGPNADKIVTGGGSGFVTPIVAFPVSEGMAVVDKKIKSSFLAPVMHDLPGEPYQDKELTIKGIKAEYFSNPDLQGAPDRVETADKVFIDIKSQETLNGPVFVNVSTRFTFCCKPEKDARYRFHLRGNDGCRIFINGKKIAEDWPRKGWQYLSDVVDMKAGELYEFVIEHRNIYRRSALELSFEIMLEDNPGYLKQIQEAGAVVVCLGHSNTTEKEDSDRTFELPEGQVEYLRKVLEYNKNVIVVVNGGGAVEMASWMGDVKAVLMAWYPGQQGGQAVAEIIAGKVNPSGKLPCSFETKWEDNPCSASYYENVDRVRSPQINPYSRVEYREGLFMGYRGYDRSGVEPLFPFGFGMSYTTFEYSDLQVAQDGAEFVVSYNVKNTGKMAGAEVSQVYVKDNVSSLVRPEKELKGFEKTFLKPGETKRVCVRLGEEAFRMFDPVKHQWVVEPGEFTIFVGASAADIRLTGSCEVR
jgi:beta-glucosidase